MRASIELSSLPDCGFSGTSLLMFSVDAFLERDCISANCEPKQTLP